MTLTLPPDGSVLRPPVAPLAPNLSPDGGSDLPDQFDRNRIAEEVDQTLFVEAGAGTGKTTALVSRLLRTVAHPDPARRIPLSQIAAITFTEKAAGELRDRLRRRLEAVQRDSEEYDAAAAATALRELDGAAVETVHAFAGRLLRLAPLAAGLPPGFSVLDAIQSDVRFQEWWQETLEGLLAGPDLERAWTDTLELDLRPTQLRGVALAFHQNWDRLPSVPLQIEEETDSASVLGVLQPLMDLHQTCLNPDDTLAVRIGALLEWGAARPDARTAQVPNSEALVPDAGALDRWLAAAPSTRVGKLGAQGNWGGKEAVAAARAAVAAVGTVFNRVREALRRQAALPLLEALRVAVRDYADRRRKEGRVDFHDLLVLARDLLRQDGDVRAHAHETYRRILVDEFQDTDPLQVEIVALIAANPADGRTFTWQEGQMEPGRLFFVGDPKQSIYRFRRADLEIYRKVQETIGGNSVALRANFRSCPEIIGWVNDTFSGLFHREQQASYRNLECPAVAGYVGGTSVRLLGEQVAENADGIRRQEADDLARAIHCARSEAWLVREADGSTRPARFADCAVLIPTRTSLRWLEAAFTAAAIPYRIESKSLIFQTQEVRELLAILRAVEDPTDAVAVVAALRSPAFACSDEELFAHRSSEGTWNYLRKTMDSQGSVGQALHVLHGYHQDRFGATVPELLDRIVRERLALELACVRPRPRDAWQRIRLLQEQARAFDTSTHGTLREFLEWTETLVDAEALVAEAVVPEEDDDAVRLLTIHASKGLEFPIVLLAGLSSDRTPREETWVLWEDNGDMAVRFGSEGARFILGNAETLIDRSRELEDCERDRLLYVAATRARDHLVVSLYHGAPGGANRYVPLSERLHRHNLGGERWVPPSLTETMAELRAELNAPELPAPEPLPVWEAARAEMLARDPVLRAEAATGIAAAIASSKASRMPGNLVPDSLVPSDLVQPSMTDRPAEAAAPDHSSPDDEPEPEQPRFGRVGRGGTHFGRAVHAVLQSVDLENPLDLEAAAQAQAAAEGIPDRWKDVAAFARRGLMSAAVQHATAGKRWREVFLSAVVEDVLIEGFIDLLVETAPGAYRIVDYKTDARTDEAGIERAMAKYRYQAATYSLAAAATLGARDVECVFVFLAAEPAQEVRVSSLVDAEDEVRRYLNGSGAASACSP